jgi:hypothetical protein
MALVTEVIQSLVCFQEAIKTMADTADEPHPPALARNELLQVGDHVWFEKLGFRKTVSKVGKTWATLSSSERIKALYQPEGRRNCQLMKLGTDLYYRVYRAKA